MPSGFEGADSLKLEGLSLVGRQRAKLRGSPTRAANPAMGATLEPGYYWADAADVDQAATLAAHALDEYGHWSGRRKAGLLRRIAELIDTHGPEIQARANLETALPLARLQSETTRTCYQLRLFASLVEEGGWVDARIDHADPERQPIRKPEVRSMRVPVGPVVVFSSSNFPLAFSVAGGDTASALAAGCPVIVKPHQGHLGTSELVALCVQKAAKDCGAPEGVFSMLYGPGPDIGIALVRHPLIKVVGFTGSRAGGRALMDAAARRPQPIPVYAEMGSINPVFLLAGALARDPHAIATGLHGSVTLGVGQFCTNPGLVFVEKDPATETFLARLTELMATTPPGAMLTAGLCAAYHDGVKKFSHIPKVSVLAEVKADAETSGWAGARLFSTDVGTFLANDLLMEEVFGPATLIVQCGSKSDMLAAAGKLECQLTATVHGTPEELTAHRDLLKTLETRVGRLVCNTFPTGVEVCHAMVHGGPYPATSDGRSTSVGTHAIERFTRPLCFQGLPDAALPEELQEANPLSIHRLVDGRLVLP